MSDGTGYSTGSGLPRPWRLQTRRAARLAAAVAGIAAPAAALRWQPQRIGTSRFDGLPAGTRLRAVHARHGDPGFPDPQSNGTFISNKADRGALAGPRFLSANKACAHLEGPGLSSGAAGAAHQPGAEVRRVHARARDNELPVLPADAGHRVGWGHRAPTPIRRSSRPRSRPAGSSSLWEVGREQDRFPGPGGRRAGRGGPAEAGGGAAGRAARWVAAVRPGSWWWRPAWRRRRWPGCSPVRVPGGAGMDARRRRR